MAAPAPQSRAGRTRAAILEAAEELFAAAGFHAARLEDVAARVGIRRASIVYHFRDKRELYDAVLDDVFGPLYDRVAAALGGPGPLAPRIDAAIEAFVDYAVRRPAFPRLLLREVADAGDGGPALERHTGPFFALVDGILRDDADDPVLALGLDPAHVASAVAGTSVFLLAALPTLAPDAGREARDADRVDALSEEVLALVRRLLDPRVLRP